MDVVPAAAADADAAVETITLAFLLDPVWSVALGRDDHDVTHLRPYWRLFGESALGHETVFISTDPATVSVWIPPGAPELSAEQETAARTLVAAALDPMRAQAMFELWDRFDEPPGPNRTRT